MKSTHLHALQKAYVCLIFSFLYVPIGLGVLAWIVSVVYVISKKFKVPVYIERAETGGFKV